MTEIIIKTFDELTLKELYELLKARIGVFVAEQNCAYQDLDDIDYRSLHVFIKNGNNSVMAYLRVFEKIDEPGTVQIGRLLTTKRGIGLGSKILKAGIKIAEEKMNCSEIYIEAQVYAIGFYEKEMFHVTSDEFLEDGIPHVQMRLKRGNPNGTFEN